MGSLHFYKAPLLANDEISKIGNGFSVLEGALNKYLELDELKKNGTTSLKFLAKSSPISQAVEETVDILYGDGNISIGTAIIDDIATGIAAAILTTALTPIGASTIVAVAIAVGVASTVSVAYSSFVEPIVDDTFEYLTDKHTLTLTTQNENTVKAGLIFENGISKNVPILNINQFLDMAIKENVDIILSDKINIDIGFEDLKYDFVPFQTIFQQIIDVLDISKEDLAAAQIETQFFRNDALLRTLSDGKEAVINPLNTNNTLFALPLKIFGSTEVTLPVQQILTPYSGTWGNDLENNNDNYTLAISEVTDFGINVPMASVLPTINGEEVDNLIVLGSDLADKLDISHILPKEQVENNLDFSNYLVGFDGNDELTGGELNDALVGGNDNDILIGGKGDDFLYGGLGDDTYIFDVGHGDDTISELNGDDVLWLDGKEFKGITLKEDENLIGSYEVSLAGNDLVFSKSNDQITLERWNNGDYGIYMEDDGSSKEFDFIFSTNINIGYGNDPIFVPASLEYSYDLLYGTTQGSYDGNLSGRLTVNGESIDLVNGRISSGPTKNGILFIVFEESPDSNNFLGGKFERVNLSITGDSVWQGYGSVIPISYLDDFEIKDISGYSLHTRIKDSPLLVGQSAGWSGSTEVSESFYQDFSFKGDFDFHTYYFAKEMDGGFIDPKHTGGDSDKTLLFADNIIKDNVSFKAIDDPIEPDGNRFDLLITLSSGEKIKIHDQLRSDIDYAIQKFKFADGEEYTFAEILAITEDLKNVPPIATDDAGTGYIVDANAILFTKSVLDNDSDANEDEIFISGYNASGLIGELFEPSNSGIFHYIPDETLKSLKEGEFVTEQFTYQISDGTYTSNDATVTIKINGVNDRPNAIEDNITVFSNTEIILNILGNDSDVDNDMLKINALSNPRNGKAIINTNNTISYIPTRDFAGEDFFIYEVSDGKLIDSAFVYITVRDNNIDDNDNSNKDDDSITNDSGTNTEADNIQQPISDNGIGFKTDADKFFITKSVLENDSYVNNLVIISTINNENLKGLLTDNGDGTFTYNPNNAFNALKAGETATDTFTYTITDGETISEPATVNITINGVNDAPVAGNDTIETNESTAITIDALANDSDVDNDSLNIVAVGIPANGSVIINSDNTLSYTPNEGFSGVDTFSYTISDGELESTASISVTVNEVIEEEVVEDTVSGGDNAEAENDNEDTISGEDSTVDETPANSSNDKIQLWDSGIAYGDAGKDTLLGANGDDTMHGGDGHDKLKGNAGDDLLYGDAGNDALYGNAGNDTIWGWTGNDLLEGHAGDDLLGGDDGNDRILAGSGDDSAYGWNGDDYISGYDGNDLLMGEEGNDTIIGGSGNDHIFGGNGQDVLRGDEGRDNFIFNSAQDTLKDSPDRIIDFEAGSDIIFILGFGFTGITEGTAQPGLLRVTYSSDSDQTYLRDDFSNFDLALDGDYRGILSDSDFEF